MTNLSPHVLASKWSHQNCCSRCSPAHVEREQLSSASEPSGVNTTISSQTTYRSQRAPKSPKLTFRSKLAPKSPKTTFRSRRSLTCHYNDLIPDDFPVPASAQVTKDDFPVPANIHVSLQLSHPRRLTGPAWQGLGLNNNSKKEF